MKALLVLCLLGTSAVARAEEHPSPAADAALPQGSLYGLDATWTDQAGKELVWKNSAGKARVVALGYAGWEAGQLESEMSQNAWLTVPMDERLLFETPIEQRWQAAGRLLGVNLLHLSSDAGHA